METTTTTTTSTVTTEIPEKIIPTDVQSQSISNWTENILYARSRNVVFKSEGLKPLTKHYTFFDGISVDRYITSKFIEINMISGAFQVGELVESDPLFTLGSFSFRLCSPNHLEGPHNNPTKVFSNNIINFPLAQTYGLTQTEYSSSSQSLNVDLSSLANPSEVSFSGYAQPSMRLVGTTSGAVAEVIGSILVSDESGFLTASFFIPDPTIQTNPKFINGTNNFVLTDRPNLTDLDYLSFAESNYYSNGTTNVTDINNITTRNYTIIPAQTINTTTITNTTQNIVTRVNPPAPPPAPAVPYVDPRTPAPSDGPSSSSSRPTVFITGDLIRSQYGGDQAAALAAARATGANIEIGAGAVANYYGGTAPSGTTGRSDSAPNTQSNLYYNPFR